MRAARGFVLSMSLAYSVSDVFRWRGRQEAHEIVRRASMEGREKGEELRNRVEELTELSWFVCLGLRQFRLHP